MKMRIALSLLLTLTCLTLAGLPAMATPNPNFVIQLYTTGGPETPSPVGEPLNNPFGITSATWICPFTDCDVTEVTFWAFDGTTGAPPVPSTDVPMNWRVGPQQFSFTDGTAIPVLVSPPGCITGDVQFCQFDIGFGRSVDVPGGLNYLQLWNWRNSPSIDNIFWSANNTALGSNAFVLNPVTGDILNTQTALAFTVFGTPTVPEPSSIMLLGSGVLGLAGVLRRKLMR